MAGDTIKVWQIGPDGTEYYAARSEQEMRDWYRLHSPDTADEDLSQHFEEVEDIDSKFEFNDDGEIRKVSWRELAEECAELPNQLSSGY